MSTTDTPQAKGEIVQTKTAELPKEVKVFGQVYKIKPIAQSHGGDAEIYGDCDRWGSTIRITKGIGRRRTQHTLLHEIMHAVYYEYNVLEGDDEERIVTQLSAGLDQVFHDNPEVVRFLHG